MKSRLVGNTHLVAGGPEKLPEVFSLLQNAGIKTEGNADVYVRTYRHFGVEEARELRERASLRAVGDLPAQAGRRVFVVVASDINREAQNALLKTLEEPPADALFFFILPAPETLLPTFRSRTQRIDVIARPTSLKMKARIGGVEEVDAEKFLAAAPQKRLDMLKPLLEKGDDDKRDTGAILAFLSAVERELAKSTEKNGAVPLYRARKYIMDKGALVKPLLEQLALLVPKV